MEIIKKIIAVVIAIGIFCGSCYVANSVETEGLFNLFRSPVTLEDLEEYPDKYVGLQAGDDIPIIESIDQIKDFDYFTVKPVAIIPVALYERKGDEIISNYYRRRGRKFNWPFRTDDPLFFIKFYYNRFYLLELEDGSYIGAYLEDYYAKKAMKGKDIMFPVAKLQTMSKEERALFEKEIESTSQFESTYYLHMYNEETYNEIRSIDIIIRIAIGFITFIIFMVGYALLKEKTFLKKVLI